MASVLQSVKARQPEWFSRDNRRFFGDVSYRVLYGKATGERYLVRLTSMFSDMFGQPKRHVWRVNVIEEDFKIGALVEDIFSDLWAVKEWLKEH